MGDFWDFICDTLTVISSSDICLNVKGLVREQNRGSPCLEEEEMSFDNQRMIFNLVTLVQFFSIPVMSSSLMLRCQKVKIFNGAYSQFWYQQNMFKKIPHELSKKNPVF